MPRRKITLEKIESESARKSTYIKRREALCKKLEELCILCDVKACMIIHNPDYEDFFCWPSIEEARELLVRFESMPTNEKSKKMLSHEEYMRSLVEKLREEIRKEEIKIKKMEANMLIHKISHGKGMEEIESVREWMLLTWFAEEKLKEIQHFRQLFPHPPSTSLLPSPPASQLHSSAPPTPIAQLPSPSTPSTPLPPPPPLASLLPPTPPLMGPPSGVQASTLFMDLMNYPNAGDDGASTSGK